MQLSALVSGGLPATNVALQGATVQMIAGVASFDGLVIKYLPSDNPHGIVLQLNFLNPLPLWSSDPTWVSGLLLPCDAGSVYSGSGICSGEARAFRLISSQC